MEVEARVETLEGFVSGMKEALAQLESAKGAIAIPNESMKPPSYDGRTDFNAYLKEFNKYATALAWQPERCCQMFPIYLTKDAKSIYDMLPNTKKNKLEESNRRNEETYR